MRTKKIVLANDTLQLDTLAMVPGSFRISANGNVPDTSQYVLDELMSMLIVRDSLLLADSIEVYYKTLPMAVGKKWKHKDTQMISKTGRDNFKPYIINTPGPSQILFDEGTLQKNGS
ncbi:MAG: hypothetical protein ACKVOR_06885, partial [Flavobacteriales bacterium]